MKKILLIIGCFSISLWAGAQTADREVVSVASENSQGETMTLQWSIGEMMVDSHNTSTGMLTEGFIQPALEIIELPASIYNNENGNSQNDLQVKIWLQ